MKSKKQLILLILKMLEANTDSNHTMTQIQIANTISSVYPCDRKTVCRNINFLKNMGYPIVKTPKGFFMDNKVFTKEEVDFVRLAILNSKNMSAEEKENLADQVADCMAKKYFIK
jgi:transcriptional regulator of NAD metabolism